MKKPIITIILATFQIAVVAQTVNIHFKNGQIIKYPSANVSYVDFSAKPSDPTVTAGQAVDLGLSIYWASCNLGAEKPEESGDYYAWGEIKPKGAYTERNYTYYDNNLMQYIEIGDDISGTQYDAATINLGSDWRMPTAYEMQELINKCSWEKTRINNILGYKVTGTNGNTIFLPLAGFGGLYVQGYDYGKCICLSTSTKNQTGYIKGISTEFSESIYLSGCPMYRGYSIRPVTSNPNVGGDPNVTEKISASLTGGSTHYFNGVFQSGSVLKAKFTNGSNELVTLVGVQINDAANGNQGNNVLEAEIEVAAGESKSYNIKLETNVTTPVVSFTYRYNNKNYKAEATWSN